MAVRLALTLFGILGTSFLYPDGDGGGNGNGDGNGDGKDFTPITTQDEFDRRVSDRLKRQETSLKKTIRADVTAELEQAAREAKATEDNDLAEKLRISEEKRLKAEQDAKDVNVQRLKDKAATKHKLPDDLAELLKGESEEDITAHAERLAKLVKVDAGGDGSQGDGESGDKGGNGESGSTNNSGGNNGGDNDAGAIGSRNKAKNTTVPEFKINPRHKITPLG